jgi:AP-2 complex subunit alpha
MSHMKGLTAFVTDIRYCQNDEDIQKRVAKELAKIRAKFAAGVKGYDLKKYIWKIIYIFMLGFDVEFGYMEAVQLVASSKYSEKNAGHIACTLMLNENNDILRLIIQAMKKDLQTGSEETQCLALHTIANVGGEEFAESLAPDVQKLVVAPTSRNFVRKKAALALLRLYRRYPEIINPETFAPQLISVLDDSNLGVVTSLSCLALGLVSTNPEPYQAIIPVCVKILDKLVKGDAGKGYIYYKTACPWLQVKLLKMLQYFPPTLDKAVITKIGEILAHVISTTEVTKSVNKNNSDYSILFEAINLIIHFNMANVEVLTSQTLSLLARFIAVKEPNIRYLGLEASARFCHIPEMSQNFKKHLTTIQYSLKQSDISIRRRALDLMFAICDSSNCEDVVNMLVAYLAKADYAIKEEMVLKIAILAERYASNFQWYVDVILKVISSAGDYVSADILHRAVQIVSYRDDLQEYAAKACYEELKSPHSHESMVFVGGYILGEYGQLIEEHGSSGKAQFEVLHQHFPLVDLKTRAMLLTAYMKMSNVYPSLKARIDEIFEQHVSYVDSEIQQRAIEYSYMANMKNTELVSRVWDLMPPFKEKESVLPKLLRKNEASTTDRNVWLKESKEELEKRKRSNAEENEEDEDEEEEEEEDEEEEDDTSLPKQKVQSLRKLLVSESGVLYESDVLQIGCKMQLNDSHQVKLILYYGNKSEDNTLENVEISQPSAGTFFQNFI